MAPREPLVLLVGVLLVTTLPGARTAAAPSVPDETDAPHGTRAPLVARGLVLDTTASDADLRQAVEDAVGRDVQASSPQEVGAVTVVEVDRLLSADEAVEAAQDLQDRADVRWAVPDVRVTAAGTPSPVRPDDPLFERQVQLWDAAADAPGGYSTKAPAAWPSSRGAGVVVAVLDTGVRPDHVDLAGRLVPGHDFVGSYPEEAGPHFHANDGDGWDADPADPGDWLEPGPACYGQTQTELRPSSWHGTHVAGVLAAEQDNGAGTSGVAPQARIQPVRVLGRCGGWTSDVLSAITWASGGSVEGVAANRTPAAVLNLSLGVDFTDYPEMFAVHCQAYADVVAGARRRGAFVVAAAHNYARGAEMTAPAACAGVFSVAATGRTGDGSWYTNTGPSVDIAAFGGSSAVDGLGVLSTVDSGRTAPQGDAYEQAEGTSMATPAAAGAAALLLSAGVRRTDLEVALASATQPFPDRPQGAAAPARTCDTSRCGAGVLDLSAVPLPLSTAPGVRGAAVEGATLTATLGAWTTGERGLEVRWERDGVTIPGATGRVHRVTGSDVGRQLRAVVTPTAPGLAGLARRSTTVRPAARVTLTAPTHSTYGAAPRLGVAAQGEQGPSAGRLVRVRAGRRVVAEGRTGQDGTVALQPAATALGAGTHRLVAELVDGGTWSSAPRDLQVARATSSISQSVASTVKRTSRPRLTVTVKVAGVPHPTGEVRVHDGSRRIATVTLSATGSGRRVITLPKLKKGKHRISTTYVGTKDVSGRTSSTRTVTSR